MSEPRFTTLTPETMTADQKRVADAIQSGPRGAGLRGPFNALLKNHDMVPTIFMNAITRCMLKIIFFYPL